MAKKKIVPVRGKSPKLGYFTPDDAVVTEALDEHGKSRGYAVDDQGRPRSIAMAESLSGELALRTEVPTVRGERNFDVVGDKGVQSIDGGRRKKMDPRIIGDQVE
jgi:hypothetical protein